MTNDVASLKKTAGLHLLAPTSLHTDMAYVDYTVSTVIMQSKNSKGLNFLSKISQ